MNEGFILALTGLIAAGVSVFSTWFSTRQFLAKREETQAKERASDQRIQYDQRAAEDSARAAFRNEQHQQIVYLNERIGRMQADIDQRESQHRKELTVLFDERQECRKKVVELELKVLALESKLPR